MGNKGYTPEVGYMMVVLHMMWISMQMVPFVIEGPLVLGLYLGKQGCMFFTKVVQMKSLI